jgi:hypothetical protein
MATRNFAGGTKEEERTAIDSWVLNLKNCWIKSRKKSGSNCESVAGHGSMATGPVERERVDVHGFIQHR